MRRKTILLAAIILALIAGDAVAIKPVRLRVLPESQRVPAPVRPDGNLRRDGETLRLQGKVDVSGRGILIGGQPVWIDENSHFFPRVDGDRELDLRRFDGRSATVFGRKDGHGGIEVLLMIVQSPAGPADAKSKPLDQPYRIPSGEGGGRLQADAPRQP